VATMSNHSATEQVQENQSTVAVRSEFSLELELEKLENYEET